MKKEMTVAAVIHAMDDFNKTEFPVGFARSGSSYSVGPHAHSVLVTLHPSGDGLDFIGSGPEYPIRYRVPCFRDWLARHPEYPNSVSDLLLTHKADDVIDMDLDLVVYVSSWAVRDESGKVLEVRCPASGGLSVKATPEECKAAMLSGYEEIIEMMKKEGMELGQEG